MLNYKKYIFKNFVIIFFKIITHYPILAFSFLFYHILSKQKQNLRANFGVISQTSHIPGQALCIRGSEDLE